MGAGSSTEQRSPQDGTTAAGESQPGSPEGQAPTAVAAAAATAEAEQPEDPSKLLHKNGQISSVNGIAEEQAELSHKPEELKEQQAEVLTAAVGQREAANVILKDESTENMETNPPELNDKSNEDDEQKDIEDANKQLPSEEKEEQPSESPSNDVGFKKVFKLVGFKFTVKKEKTEKMEPVQLLNVKAEVTEGSSDGAGDCKEFKTETEEEATQSEIPDFVEMTEEETQTEEMKEETSEKVTESPVEAESKEAEIKMNGNKSPESPVSPLTSETASPLRKFFTQGWAGFRKRTSFRKPKEEEAQTEKEKQEQKTEKEMTIEGIVTKEELEKEKLSPEKDRTEVSLEASDEKMESEKERGEETKMIEVSTETNLKEAATPSEQPSTEEGAENINKEVDISLKGKTDLELEEKLEPVQESLIGLEQSTVALSEEKPELGAPLLNEVFEEKINQSDSLSPVTVEKPEEPFEIIEEKSEPKAPLATEIFDEKPTEVVTKEELKTTKKEQLVLEQLVKTKDDFQKEQPTVDTVEQLKVLETVPEIVKEHFQQTDPNNLDAATHKAPEGITSEVELLSSQEKAKMQGSPLKKLFTGTGLKKLSGKKHKGKKEEAKPGEAAEQIQQLSDSAESPDDPRAESSASSPEEMTESVEKASEAAQIPEGEEGSPSEAEKKRESVTPWASFKKMVTPKKRVRRLSESDREEELDKTKSATLSSTESAPNDEQDDIKENDEEQKIEKSADEPKRKVDTSVSWEALICVGSSKKRTRKSSSSDEEVGQRLAQDGQKLDEGAPNKEAVHDIIFTNSHESDQGQGNSSPEQAGSPSETEGVSTWESFKRLVTPRRKSKTKMEEKNDEPTTVPSLEHATLDGDAGKEESWVSFKKLMPGRRKKKSDGIPEHVPVQEAGEKITGTNEEDSDVPAVVPLSEYEAAEQEKFEAQKTEQEDKKTSSQNIEKSESTLIIEQASEGLVHAVAVSVVEGERAVTSIEERSPSWISAAVTESIEHVNEDEKKSEQISGTGIVEETVVVTKLIPHMRKNISGDTIVSELELTSEAVTAREEASGVEETTEISCAEETTEMVSAVSRLTESPDTTEIATPVQEIEESEQDLEELNKQTQERLQVVAERIKLSDGKGISEDLAEVTVQPLSAEKIGHEISAISKEVELPLNEVVQINEVTESCETQIKVKEDGLKEMLKKSNEMLVEGKEESEPIASLELVESHHPKTEQESVKQYEEIIGEQTVEEKSDEGFVIVTVTPDKQPEIEVSDTFGKQQMLLKEMDSEEYKSTDTMQEIIMNLEETTQNKVTESVPEMDELEQVTCDEKSLLYHKQEEIQNNLYDLESQPSEIILVEVNEAVAQNEVRDFGLLTESPQTEVFVPEAAIQSQLTEVPPSTVKDVAFGTEMGSTEEAAVEACVQSKDSCTSLKNEAHIQKVGPEVQLQKLESRISQTDVKTEQPFLLYEETQILAETMEKEMSPQVMEMDVHKLNAKAEAQVINDHVEELEIKSQVRSGEAEVLVEKAELKVDMELSTEKAKTESPTEKVIIEGHLKEEEAQLSAEKAHTKLEREVCQGKIDVEVDEEKIEKVEVRVPEEMVNGTVFVETSTEQIDAKLESGVPVEKADTKVDEEASKKKTDADVEAAVPAGKTIIEPLQDQADAKLNGEIFAMKGDIKSHAENMDAEIAKNESDILNCLPADRKHLTEGAAAESTVEKTVTELLAEEVVASMEKVDTKAGVEVFTEKVDEKANADVPAEQRATQIPIEQSDGMMVTEAIGRELELKETLQNVMNEVRIQSEVEDSGDSLSKICDAVVSNEPSRREEKDASSTVEKPTEEAVLENLSERDLLHISAPVQTAMDQIQKYVEDPNLTFPLECTERISAKASETEELKDVTLEESKCTEESGIEIPMQKKLLVLPSETEAIDTGVSEGLMQNEKEDTLIHLEPQYSKTKGAAETLENEEALNSVKNELGNGKLPVGRESAGKIVAEAVMTEEEGDLLISDSRFIESVVSNVILGKKRERKLPDVKSEVQEVDMSDTSVKTETHLEELPVETVRSPSESKAASEGCQGTLQLLEMVQIMEIDKAVQKPELAADGVLYAAPIQEPFTDQQEDASTDIHDLQSYADYISSVTITAAAEEGVIAEHVTLTETSTETLQTSLQEPKEPASKTIQFRSFVLSESGILYPDPDAVAFSEKIDSVIEESVLSAVRCTKEGLLQKCVFDSTLKMELPESSSNEESKQKVMTPERSPSTEFPKDVQSVTIESQSSKIVQKIIQNAVDKLEQTEEAISSLKQESEACLVSGNESGIQEDVQVSQQISVAEEKNHEIQPTSVTAEKKAIRVAKEMPLSSTESENGEKLSSRKTDGDLETVKDIVNETERKNGDSKSQLEMDTAVSTETQKNMLGSIVSRDLPKGSLQIEQSTITDLEVGLIVENQEKLIQHQTHRKRKEDYSQSTEFPEMHKEEDFTSCESPQLQAKLRES